MDLFLVVIEHCKKCPDHAWCTNHDETKYLNYHEKVTLCITSTCPEVHLETNNSLILQKVSSCMSQNNLIKKMNFPRLGSFEVLFRNKVVFSKLSTGRWPNPMKIAEDIRNVIDGIVVHKNVNENNSPGRPSTGLRKSQSAYAIRRNKVLI